MRLNLTHASSNKKKWQIIKPFMEASKIPSKIDGKMESTCSWRKEFFWKMTEIGKKFLKRMMMKKNKSKTNQKKPKSMFQSKKE